MSRLTARFEQLRTRQEKALVCFVTAGDPTPEKTVAIVTTLAKAGVDLVEIGIPFSDPLADGPSIQAASQRALDTGMSTRKALALVREIRATTPDLPIVLMTYYNPLLRYGLDAYARDAHEAGADAHIVTDLTPEEAGEWKRVSELNGLDTVFLVAPTSTPARIATVAELSTGFVYCVSRTGVTGARQDVPTELRDVIAQIKARTEQPVCVGFGISTPEHVALITAYADGAVVGSRLVDLIHAHRDSPDLLLVVHDYVASLKAATRSGYEVGDVHSSLPVK